MRFKDSYDWSLDAELNKLERVFKDLYQQDPDLRMDLPHETAECVPVLNRAAVLADDPLPEQLGKEPLEENAFFAAEDDIEVYRHLRYLPCNWHTHDFLEVICVIQGGCVNYIAEQRQELQEGDICIVAPETRHAISAFSDSSIILNILIRVSTFETAFFGTLLDDNILSRFFRHSLYQSKSYPFLLFRTYPDQSLFNFVGYAYDESVSKKTYKNRMLTSILMAFFVLLLRNHGADVIVPELSRVDQNKSVYHILKHMQEHYAETSLPEMAAMFNYSERQIQRLVAEATGMSFSANILRLKMNRAEHLLAHSERSVAEIAEELGYTDPRNFRQTFKKYFGKTPTEYRGGQPE